MSETVYVAVPRKGRPLEAVLDRLAGHPDADEATATVADDVSNVLRHEKAVTKGKQDEAASVYDRLEEYSTPKTDRRPDFTLMRDSRAGFPRRVVFDSVTVPLGDVDVELVGREEPFRALRTHEFALGFDSADLVLEEVVGLEPAPLESIRDLNDRIDPHDTDVRVVTGLGDTVHHTLLGTPETIPGELDREFVADYEGPFCVSPRYERLVEAVLGTDVADGLEFVYPDEGEEEEAGVADAGVGAYLTVTGSTARDHGLLVGERLFPSETVLMENSCEVAGAAADVRDALSRAVPDTALAMN